MIVDELKSRITRAMKEKDDVARDVLRLALSEIQAAEARSGRAPTDEEAAAILRKLVKSNDETLAQISGEDPKVAALRHENDVLSSLLPKRMTVDEIVAALADQTEAIRAAKNDGQATGIAMKHLKGTGASFDGADVGTAVKRLRA